MNESDVRDVLERTGAVLRGHFLLSSGLHADTYIQCAKVMEHPGEGERLCRELASRWKDITIDVVAGPAFGGIIPAYEIARHLGARAVFFERAPEDRFELRRGFSVHSARVLVAEDVVTTGGSAREVVREVKALGGNVVGVTCLVFRGEGRIFEEELRTLLPLRPPTWTPAECPMCARGHTAVKPGSRPC